MLDAHIGTSALARHMQSQSGVHKHCQIAISSEVVLQIHLDRCFVSFLCAGSFRGTSAHESDNISDGLHHQVREHIIRDRLPSLHAGQAAEWNAWGCFGASEYATQTAYQSGSA